MLYCPPATPGAARLSRPPDARPPRRRPTLLAAALLLACAAAPACAAPPPDGTAPDETAAPCAPGNPAPGQTRLRVTATGARPVKGNVTFTLYGANPAAFLAHRGSIALARVTLLTAQAEACFDLSAPGAYAVAIYHDANDNHHFDRTLLGLPAEGYGFSNNIHPLLLPAYASARITVPAGESRIAIALIY